MDKTIQYIKGANWAVINGPFTPDDLREIADEIEERTEQFQKDQENTKG